MRSEKEIRDAIAEHVANESAADAVKNFNRAYMEFRVAAALRWALGDGAAAASDEPAPPASKQEGVTRGFIREVPVVAVTLTDQGRYLRLPFNQGLHMIEMPLLLTDDYPYRPGDMMRLRVEITRL